MLKEENKDCSMSEFLQDYDVKRLTSGQIIKGKVMEVNDKQATINIDYAYDGIISKEDISLDEKDPRDVLHIGDVIDVYVISPNDGEGVVKLSLLKALEINDRKYIKQAFENGENISVVVSEEVKGGLIAFYGSIRIFIPASLASRERIELQTLIGKRLDVKIEELNFKNNRIIASRRVIEEQEYQKEKELLWAELKEGEKRRGVVKKLVKFGAFVDINGIQGLIHLSDLSWERVKRPEDVVKEGDVVEVFIGKVDRDNERLALILKDISKEPWSLHENEIEEGSICEGKVTKFVTFGAFVELFDGVEGLVHISEITDDNIAKPSDVLELNQKVRVKILSYNKEDKRLSLSIKEAVEGNKEYLEYVDNEESGTSLGELFKNLKF